MNVALVLNRIKNDTSKIKVILDNLNMHHIKEHQDYFSCGFDGGDNQKSCVVYKDSLNVEAYTRNIRDKFGYSNIINLIMFVESLYFIQALKRLSDICGYDYYQRDYKPPRLLEFIKELKSMSTTSSYEDLEEVQPINEDILKTYINLPSKVFKDDGIDYKTQILFGIGYDLSSHRITIPIRDELGFLVGVKGRIYDIALSDNKYMFIEPCAKSQILFGLNLTYSFIIESGIVYVAESEKAVMQAWSAGVKNVISIGGHQLSKSQIKKLTHLGVEICLCYDDKADFVPKIQDGIIEKDKLGNTIYTRDNDFYIKEKRKFIDGITISKISDINNKILKDKDSPFDHMGQWEELLNMRGLII